ncbi:Na+/H+ antiporter [Nakamurella alba]|uniref:Na+/H+ antiporter n=1 Tax=Nakamurella alba TaxID=2665158 RepID=UPI0018AAA416|nr:Na+/H+ antiporter [Nakamurella alba]
MELLPVIGLVLGVLAVTALAARISFPAPVLLVVAGVAVSFVPGVPDYQVSPELVLSVLLPPLLFGAAFESSAVAIRRLLRPIAQLSVVLVLLTALAVAGVTVLLVPEMPFGAALALGAAVAPPDAVAAVAVARRVGLPRGLVTVLEGESLFNDATSLTLLRVAIGAVGMSGIAWWPAFGRFSWAAVGGLLIGLVLGWVFSQLRRRMTMPLTTTAMGLLAPFAAYEAGELAHASGVLAVVVCGLLLGHRSPQEVAAAVRLTESATWASVRFVLEGAVFALIGLQLVGIVRSLDTEQHHVWWVVALVPVTVILSRPVLISLIHLVSRVVPGRTARAGPRSIAALSWAGMRGVVSLAAVQALPVDLPFRSLIQVATVATIVGTLVLQGLTLPAVVRRLGIAEDRTSEDLAERAEARAAASAEITRQVDELQQQGRFSEPQAELMRKWAALRDWRNWDDPEQSKAFGRELSAVSDWRRALLGIERTVIVGLRNDGRLSEDVLTEMQHELDLEEALLERRSQAVDGHLEELPDAEDSPGSGGPQDPDEGHRSDQPGPAAEDDPAPVGPRPTPSWAGDAPAASALTTEAEHAAENLRRDTG